MPPIGTLALTTSHGSPSSTHLHQRVGIIGFEIASRVAGADSDALVLGLGQLLGATMMLTDFQGTVHSRNCKTHDGRGKPHAGIGVMANRHDYILVLEEDDLETR